MYLVQKAMNNIKRIFSILTSVCCLVLCCSFAVSATEGIPRVTFHNAEKNSPDLYITKKVTNASEDNPAPADATFDFILSVNGDLYAGKEYTVLDASGKEVKNTGSGGITSYWSTDRSGIFTLQAGQTAVFEDVGNGSSYEVEELLDSDDYIQIRPAGGGAAGTVKPKGSSVVFENLYNPLVDDPSVETTTLVITNIISFPDGYTPWETGDFTFSVQVGGKALANEPYTITNTADGREVDKRTTDENGNFTLGGGQTATFEEVAANVDYEVAEKGKPAEWSLIKADNATGAMKSPITYVVFTYGSAAFSVSKTMEDGTHPEKEFEFVLTDGNGDVWGNARYYLYNSLGKLVETDKNGISYQQPLQTDKDGVFYLQPEQTAIFVGIAQGTAYSVREEETEDYEQVTPVSENGYTRTVKSSVEDLPFVNRTTVPERVLTVTKSVENMTNIGPTKENEGEFTFQLLRNRAEPGEKADYQPVSSTDYVIKDETGEHSGLRTNEDGEFKILADDTAIFTALLPGEYKVVEVEWDDRYTPKEETEQTGELEDEELSFTFVNQYWRVPPTGIKGLSGFWKVLIGVVVTLLIALAAIILVRRRKQTVR